MSSHLLQGPPELPGVHALNRGGGGEGSCQARELLEQGGKAVAQLQGVELILQEVQDVLDVLGHEGGEALGIELSDEGRAGQHRARVA